MLALGRGGDLPSRGGEGLPVAGPPELVVAGDAQHMAFTRRAQPRADFA